MRYNFNDIHQTHKEFEIPLTILHNVELNLISMDPISIIGKKDKEEVLLHIITDNPKFNATLENFDTLIIRGKSATQKIGFSYTDAPLYHAPTMKVHEPLPEPSVDHDMLSDINMIRNHLADTGSVQHAKIRSRFEPEGFPSLYEIDDDMADIFEEEEEFIRNHKLVETPPPQPEPEALPQNPDPIPSSLEDPK